MTIDKDRLPIEDIIPITYMSGTGGNFLCHFIVTAKRGDKRVIELSNHGNAHENGNKDISNPAGGYSKPDIGKIEHILSQDPQQGSQKPYFTAGHIFDLELILQYFKKSIRLTYELDDISDLTKVMFGKFYVDDNPNKNNFHTPEIYKSGFMKVHDKFQKQDIPNILFISWKELYNGNIDDLILKLSIFTDIDIDNFSKESLIYWRKKTQYCIEKFNIQVN